MEANSDQQEGPSTERAFETEPLPSLSETITARSMGVSLVLGTMLTIVAMKLNLTSGFVPTLNIPGGLLGFFISRVWIRILNYYEVPHLPFTRQENTVIQTCIVACSSIAFSGGFGTYVLAMSKKSTDGGLGSDEKNIEEPNIGRMIAFLFLVSFAGLFAIVSLRKVMIIRHQLTYPSGMATAHLINSFHTPQGANQARQQVSFLFKSFGGTIMWSFFQWFFAGGKDCGFQSFPTFGLDAYQRGFYFDFSMTNIGVGMICPYLISISMLIGSIISWGILWPYIETREGTWYPRNLDSNSLSGIQGYKLFLGISLILADGLFHFLSIFLRTMYTMHKRSNQARQPMAHPFQCLSIVDRPTQSFDDRRRAQVFVRDQIPISVASSGYCILSIISVIAISHLYAQLKYHHIALVYLVAPIFAFCNAYGTGISDISLASTYGKITLLVFGSWVGLKDGGVIVGLVACGIVIATVSTASDFMQDFKTGYLTLTSPRAIFISQVIGTTLGCIINPIIFWVFYKVYNTGTNEIADIPYAKVYRGIVMLGIGRHDLPKYSMLLCKLFFLLALVLSVLREVANKKEWCIRHYIPSTIGIAVAFFVSPKMPIGMCIGSLVMYLWGRIDSNSARLLSPAVASGFICGDGLGSLLSSILTLFKAHPPICIKFLSRVENDKVDAFLATLPLSS